MKDNNYKYMLLTGKYLPEENIQLNGSCLFFRNYNVQGNKTYYEDSDGNWEKSEYNDKGNLIYRETSACGVLKDEREYI